MLLPGRAHLIAVQIARVATGLPKVRNDRRCLVGAARPTTRCIALTSSAGPRAFTIQCSGSGKRSSSTTSIGSAGSSPVALQPKDAYYSQCYCISSWFRLPEQGMDNYELLSRASGFLVRRASPDGSAAGTGVHIVTSAHVVHPFAFPNYYPPEEHGWLRFVGEQHVMTKFEIRRRPEGEVVFSTELHEKVFRHATRDVCVLHPQDQDEFARALERLEGGAAWHILRLEDDDAAKETDQVMFVGHQIIETSGALQEQLPTVVSGRILGTTPHGQSFASTESTLQMGMCGGPVMNVRDRCIGCTEGIVPATGPEPLRLCAAVITAGTVRSMLVDVEQQLCDEFPPR